MARRLTEKLNAFLAQPRCRASDHCNPGFVSGAEWAWGDTIGKVSKILANFPEANVPDKAICFFKDGDKWCCVHGDFLDLESSPAGFGDTFEQSLIDLQRQTDIENAELARLMVRPLQSTSSTGLAT